MKDDKIFKFLLIVLGLGFLFIYYQESQIGRYQFREESSRTVIDTKTGTVYYEGEVKFKIE